MTESKVMSTGFSLTTGNDEDIIPQNPVKMLRFSILSLIVLMDNRIEPRYWMHLFITCWRILQQFGASLLLMYGCLWDKKSSLDSTLNVLSYLLYGTSTETVHEMSVPFLFVFSAILFIYLIILVLSTLHYNKTADLSTLTLNVLSITQNTVIFILQPFASLMCGSTICEMALKKTYYSTSLSAAAVICMLVPSLVYFYLYTKVFSQSLLFRPTSVPTITSSGQIIFFIGQNVIFLLTGIGCRMTTKYGQITIISLTIVATLFMSKISFSATSFVVPNQRYSFFTSCLMAVISGVVGIIYLSLNIVAAEIEFLVFCALSILIYIITSFCYTSYLSKKLRKLDLFASNTEALEDFEESVNESISLIVIGFSYAHPICINWTLFKKVIDKWPQSVDIWLIYAKFVAIYPLESSRLTFIAQSIISNNLKGNSINQLYLQTMKLVQAREQNLSPIIKIKMKKLQQQIDTIKRKLRSTWDQVMQKNYTEIDISILHVQIAIEKTTAQFHHLLEDYPNNKFIARQYSKYVLEILADRQQYEKWLNNSNLLKRGITINPDKGNYFGLQSFPLLPEVCAVNKNSPVSLDQTDIATDDYDPDALDINDILIKELINDLKFAGINMSQVLIVIFFILFYCGSLIALLVGTNDFLAKREETLSKVKQASFLRSMQFQISTFLHHYLLENIPQNNPLFDKPNTTGLTFVGFGGERTTKGKIKFITKRAIDELDQLAALKHESVKNDHYILANKYLYEEMIPYKQFKNVDIFTYNNKTMSFAIMDMCMQTVQILEKTTYSPSDLNHTHILNVVQNSQNVADAISEGLDANILYVYNQSHETLIQSIIIFSSLSAAFAVIYIIVEVILYKNIKKSRTDCYSCLTALPKNVVVKLCDNILSMGKNSSADFNVSSDPEELSRQDENIIKIFSNVGNSNYSQQSISIGIISSVLILLFFVASINLAALMFQSISGTFVLNAPHLSSILGSYGYLIGTMLGLNTWAGATNGYKSSNLETSVMYTRAIERMSLFQDYFNHARYGGSLADEKPYLNFNTELQRISSNIITTHEEIPSNLREIYNTLSPSISLRLVQPLIVVITSKYISGETSLVNTHSEAFNELWYLSAYRLYEEFFHPMFSGIVPNILETAYSVRNSYFAGIFLIFAFAIISRIVTMYIIQVHKEKMMFALNLLCYTKPENIFQNNKIMDYLSGNLSKSKKESTILTKHFFDEVVASLPDCIIISNAEFRITHVNKSTEKLFLTTAEELKGMDVHDLMSSKYFSVPPQRAIFNSIDEFDAQIKREDESIIYLKLLGSFSGTSYVISIRDETPVVVYNKLIAEERGRSDRLLETILPPALVRRVQTGERNISFTVQSASVCFIDIVEFTPWCAANTASMVMKTLNFMFKGFDQIVAKYSMLSRIKCIGDCYMMAGGIFSEVNQPAVHAKESVEFGIDTIQFMGVLNADLGHSLRIRVGINTGGPIVAGVIGSGKPTFEILGPTINMAQQMEHHGVPMNVHISRSIYELVYGGPFAIKERGMIEIKGGSVLTYLVTGKQKK